MKLCAFFLSGGIVASALAQSHVFVPASASTLDGYTGGRLPGLREDFRLQVVVGASHLGGLNRPITALTVRRDGQVMDALQGGRSRFTLRISDRAGPPSRASAIFADNHQTQPLQVFSGEIDYPASPALMDRHAARWLPEHTVSFPFSAPFVYGGGSLCVEVEGGEVLVGSGLWPVDFFADPLAMGSVQPLGPGCGQYAGNGRRGAAGQPHTLTVGSTTRVFTWGQPGTPAVLMVGINPLGAPLDALGAPGCFLHVVPELTLTAWLSTPARADLPGHVPFAIQIPSDGSLLAGAFLVQAGNLELRPPFTNPAHITTSQGLSLRIGPTVPALDAAVVESAQVQPYPANGHVDTTRAPVLRLTMN